MVRTCTYPGCMRRTASQSERRCALHPLAPRPRTAAYNRLAREIAATATHCALCGQPRWPADVNPETGRHDPMVCDHRVPRAHGGASVAENLQPAHKSCNDKKGSRVASWGPAGRDEMH
jgi:5-methylcytosine-specific restriction endonuclease McrA